MSINDNPKYELLKQMINKKIRIISNTTLNPNNKSEFYFEIKFDCMPHMGLCYDSGFENPGRFCIYYFKMTDDWPKLIMTNI